MRSIEGIIKSLGWTFGLRVSIACLRLVRVQEFPRVYRCTDPVGFGNSRLLGLGKLKYVLCRA